MKQASVKADPLPDPVVEDQQLPEGWAYGTLEDMIGPGGILTDGDWVERKDQDPYGDVRLIQLADIGDGYYRNKSQRYLTSQKAVELRCSYLQKGDVLIARMAEPLGRACIFPGDKRRAVTAVDVCIVRTGKRSILPPWIMHTVNSPVVRRHIEGLQRGTTRGRISRRNLVSVSLPVPPLAEQKRIVAKVEQLLARVNAARERLAKAPEILKRFRQSVLAAACSGRLTADWRNENSNLEAAARLIKRIFTKREEQFKEEVKKTKVGVKKIPKKPARLRPRKVEVKDLPEIPEQWAWVYLPDLGYMSRGKSRHRPRNAPHLYGGPYPFIQTGDIARCGGRITSHQQTYSEEGLAQSRLWTVGTVCITIAANIASSAILTYPACFPDSVVGVNPDVNLCLPEYLEFFIRTAQADLDQFAPATAQKNINVAILNDVVVPLPPFAEQQEIVRRVNSLFKLADAIDNRVEVASVRAEKLIQSILAKAFRGELVPNEAELARREGRDYEPALVLLERIKAERETIRKERRPKKQIVSRRRSHRKLAKATAT